MGLKEILQLLVKVGLGVMAMKELSTFKIFKTGALKSDVV